MFPGKFLHPFNSLRVANPLRIGAPTSEYRRGSSMEVRGFVTPDFFIITSLITVEADVATTPKISFGSGQLVGIFNIQNTNKGTVMIRVLNDTE